jgi:hypothetical protein
MECEDIVVRAAPCDDAEGRIIRSKITSFQTLDDLFLASNDKLVKLVVTNSDCLYMFNGRLHAESTRL